MIYSNSPNILIDTPLGWIDCSTTFLQIHESLAGLVLAVKKKRGEQDEQQRTEPFNRCNKKIITICKTSYKDVRSYAFKITNFVLLIFHGALDLMDNKDVRSEEKEADKDRLVD